MIYLVTTASGYAVLCSTFENYTADDGLADNGTGHVCYS
jgi:hypothetical protein